MSVNHNLNSPHTSTSAFQNNSGLSALMNDLDDDDDEWLNNVDLEEVTDNLTSQLNHSFEDFDNNSGDSWIFPIGYEKREYQLNISRSCLFTNTLVCLPTGLGKTFIASVVIYNFYRWFPRSKIIFMAHSRPLVHQQIDACYKVVGIPPNETAELTGKISRDKRVELWNNKRVFFATPQVIQNDICDPAFPTNAIKLVIVDEAHKAKGRFSYCEVIKGINNANHKFRVVALSATPGKSDDVVEIIKNLLISKIEVRTEDSFDVKKYTFVKDIEIVRVQLGELAEIRDRFIEIYDSYLRKLIELKAISANIFNKGFLIKQQKDFHLQNHPQKSEINKLFSIAISLLYSLDLLERHGLQIFLNSFSDENNVTKLKYFVGQDRSLKDFLHHLNEKYKDTSPLALNINPLPSGEVPIIDDKNLNYGHLKYDVLKQQLTEYFNNGGAKVIIFCEYRDTVRLVYTLLLQLRPTVLPRMLMGQSGAVSQKDQLKAMEDFRSNKVNVLVTTSVCEEGIDVGEVDLVICFDISSKNPTRFVQRIGRTGRKRKGKVLILATEGKEEEDIKKVIRSKDKMNISIHGQKEITKNLYRNAPRLVPNAFNPKCVETKFNIPDLKIETKPDTKTNRIAGKKPKNETATSYPTRSITSHFAPTKKRSKDIPQEKNLIVEVQDDLVPENAQVVRRSPVSEFSSGKSFEKIKNDFLDDSRSIIIKIEQNLILMTHIKWKQKTDLKALDERCQLFDDNVNENDSITLDTSWKKHLDDSMNLKQSYELSSQFEEVPARRINKNIYQSQEALVEVESRYGNQFSVPEPFNTPFKTSNFNKILNTPTPGSSGITKVVTAGKKTPMKDSPLFKAFQKQRDMSLSSTPVSSRLKTSFKHTQSLNISSDQPLVETSSTTPSNFSPKRNATSLEERSREMTALEFFGITSIDDIFVDDDSEDESSSAHNTATKVSLERDSYAKLLEQDDDVFLGIPIEDEIVESSVVDGISLNGTKEPKAKNDKFEINLEDIFVDSDESTEELEKNIESLPSDLSQSTTQEYYQKESPQKSITFEEPLMTKENVQVVNSCIIEVTSPSPKSILKRPRPNFSKLMNALKSSNFLSPTSSIPTVKSPVKGALQDTSNIRNKALVLTSNNNFTTSTSKYQNARFTSKVSVLPSSSKKFPSQRRQKKKVASPKITNFLLDSSLKSSRTADITQVNDPEESLVVSDGNDSEKNSPVALTAARGSRKRKRKNHFFDTQAGVDGTDSSDDEVDLTTLDGFIANETMDLTNVEEDDHAHYLQSIRSPSSRPNGNFKIPKLASPMSHSMIYSQIPQHDDEDDWEMGSFIVDTVEDQTIESEPDELEIAERLLEEKRKRANQRKNRGKRRRVVRVEDSSDEELKEMMTQNIRIPDRLIYCYRGNFTEYWNPKTLPMVIEILRKIEASHATSVDLRHMSARLFHDLRVDGIQRSPFPETEDVTPYSRNIKMSHKNNVLRQLISNVAGEFNYEQILTPSELCTLHKMLSSSVEPLERHDELRNCPLQILNATRNQMPNNKIPRPRDPSVHHRQPMSNFTVVGPNFSRCPVELGVVFDSNGIGVHPGVLIANIASGLQPQQVKIGEFVSEYRVEDPFERIETMEASDNRKKIAKLISSLSSIDNTYASGLVGDLAEVVLFQGPLGNFTIGFSGMWNDTDFPRMFHLEGSQSGNWHLTDTEILSGIDGIFISQQVAAWTSRIRRLRLSQVLEMFYLHQGISIPTIESNLRRKLFKGRSMPGDKKQGPKDLDIEVPAGFNTKKIFKKSFNYKKLNEEMVDVDIKYLSRFSISEDISAVCHRKKIVEMIDVEKLKEETLSFVQILEIVTNTPLMSPALLKSYTNIVVDLTMDYARKLVEKTPDCLQFPLDHTRTAVDLILIIDGSRTLYENLQLIHSISEMIDVSSFGSYISIIHGSTGQFLVNRTNSVANLFEQLRNSTLVGNPIRLSLSSSLRSLMFQLVNQTTKEKESGVYGALPKVCLVVSQSHRIGEMDFESAQRILLGSMKQFPDLYFVFLSNDINTFKEMVGDPRERSARLAIETSERYHYVSANSIHLATFKKELDLTIRSIPKRITSPFCKATDAKPTWDDIMKRDEFEEYLSLSEEVRYRISSFYLLGSDEVRIKFQGVGYGDVTICVSREQDMLSKECKSLQDMENAWFNLTRPCDNQNVDVGCRSVYFSLQVDTTYIKCSESDCRFPDDVRILVRPEGLRCERSGVNRITAKLIFIIFLAFISNTMLNHSLRFQL